MIKSILLDTILIDVRAPRGLPNHEYHAMLRTLMGPRFIAQLRSSVLGVVRRYRALGKAKVRLTR